MLNLFYRAKGQFLQQRIRDPNMSLLAVWTNSALGTLRIIYVHNIGCVHYIRCQKSQDQTFSALNVNRNLMFDLLDISFLF